MEILFGLVAAAIAGSVAYLVSSERRRDQRAAWQAAASAQGLESVEQREGGFFEGAGRLVGRSGPLRVRLESYRRGKHEHGTRIVVDGLGHEAGGLTLRREGLATAFEKRVIGEREVEIGDAGFDAEYFVQGSPALALALFTPGTRARLAELLRGTVPLEGGGTVEVQASLAYGVLTVEVKESGWSDRRRHLPAILGAAIGIGRLLAVPRQLAERLAENLEQEREPGVRLALVTALAREFPDLPAARGALLSVCADASPGVRLRAAVALGEEGRETLAALLQDDVPDEIEARAIAALGERLPTGVARERLGACLAPGTRTAAALACIERLAHADAVECEAALVAALACGDPKVQQAAARALGRVGSVAAVAAIRDVTQPRGELLRSVSRQAVAEIQARQQGAAPGQLSLAGAEAGALSLTDGGPGGLSLAEEGGADVDAEDADAKPARDAARVALRDS